MIPYTERTKITRDDTLADEILVTLNGVLLGRATLIEAVAGPLGYVIQIKHDADGKPLFRDDQMGSIDTDMISGDVQFFTGDPRS